MKGSGPGVAMALGPRAAPEEGRSPRAVLAILLVVTGMLGAVRTYVYSDFEGLTPERYDVPIRLEHYHLEAADPELPEGLDPGAVRALDEAARLPACAAELLALRRPGWSYQLSEYQRRGAKSYALVSRAPKAEGADVRGGERWVQDRDLFAACGPDAAAVEAAVRAKAARVKEVTVTVEKMKVLGNAYLKFTMEILLGLFFTLTAMILAKLFFIRKQLEE